MTVKGLQGIRVLEIGEMVSAPYATKLLADLGADVIKVEPPAGDAARRRGPFRADPDPEASGLFLGLNTNKRSVVADLATENGQATLHALIAETDIIVHNLSAADAERYGLGADGLLATRPDLVICAITPFGHTGPQADWRGEELTIVHAGGWGWLVPGDNPSYEAPPIKVFGHIAHFQAGMTGAMAALAAFAKSTSTGVGEFIDVSVQACVAAILETAFIAWSYLGNIATRAEGRLLNPWGIFQAADGLVFLVTVEADQWDRLVAMMGNPDWATLDIFADFEGRAANRDILRVYIEEWMSGHTVEDLFHRGQAERICFAPVLTMADLADQEHLSERGFLHTVEHPVADRVTHLGSPYLAEPNHFTLGPAPLLDQHAGEGFAPRPTAQPETAEQRSPGEAARTSRPLDGVRVLDFSWVWAGPYCTLNLSHLGAEVIKVESANRPGLGRRLPFSPPDVEPSLNTSAYFNQWDQGKRSVELDLTDPAAIEQVLGLVAEADVVVDNYATGVMDRLGLTDDALRSANPDVILASITGYGHAGPLATYMGYGPTTAPLSGLASLTGYPDEGMPREAGISFGDPAGGLAAAFGICAGLITRDRTGVTSRIDTTLWEATAVNAIEGWMVQELTGEPQQLIANRDPLWAPHGVFPCGGADSDEWIAIACTTDDEWAALAAEIEPDLAGDERFATTESRKQHEDELEAIVSAWTDTQDKWQVTRTLQGAGVAAYPSLSCQELEADAQLIARGFFERLDHPEVGRRAHTGVPWLLRNSPNGVQHRAPLLGEHTADYLP